MSESVSTTWLPDLVFIKDQFTSGVSITAGGNGRLALSDTRDQSNSLIALRNRAALPGLVNTHSHAFQRVIRGRTEYRSNQSKDTFWTWREMMYRAANQLTPEDIYDASRMAFLEMALSGITTVGEFHYVHHSPQGEAYDDPNLLAKQVIRAARDVGLRIALLRVAYARAGYQAETNPRQARFIEANADAYLRNVSTLRTDVQNLDGVSVGVAPHSIRAVPLNYLSETIAYANEHQLPIHMHVAEQTGEVDSCIKEYGRTPLVLLHSEGLLSDRFTAVHAIHVTPREVAALAQSRANVCACPTTERNLGDGIIPADMFFASETPVSLGSDSHVQIDLLEDARELEYHLRLQRMERSILARAGDSRSDLAKRLLDCATVHGAKSLSLPVGEIQDGYQADFFTVDLGDPSIAGFSKADLLPGIVFGLSRTAVRDVIVGGEMIVKDGRHKAAEEIVDRFKKLQNKLWQ